VRRGGFTAVLILVLGLAIGCSSAPSEPRIELLDSPAPPGSRFPSVALQGDRVYLSWIEGEEPDATVNLVTSEAGHWGEVEQIAAGSELFVNWADFPSIAVDGTGGVAAQWLVRGGGPSWAYGVRFSARTADGPWSAPRIPHGSDHAGEHGFVSIVSAMPGGYELVWLDGRAMEDGGPMELRQAGWTAAEFDTERVLDRDVCTCCQTDMAAFGDQRFVVYRDHAPGEIRDISYVRFDGANWSAPTTLHQDGWQIAACPVNGPAVAARDARLAVAWFTQANDQPFVQARVSDDFGSTFGDPLRLDEGDPIGRVDVAALSDGSFVVVWLERSGDAAAINARRVSDGVAGQAFTIASVAAHRGSGFPRVATDGSDTWIAWTETSRPPRVRLARVRW
jgi:hypothetical protein